MSPLDQAIQDRATLAAAVKQLMGRMPVGHTLPQEVHEAIYRSADYTRQMLASRVGLDDHRARPIPPPPPAPQNIKITRAGPIV